MRRGFKGEAEKIAVAARKSLGLSESAPLPARSLAKALDVVVVGPRDIPGMPAQLVNQMLFDFAERWSGVTIPVNGQTLIVHNTAHAPTRQESDLMHELAHILRKHKPARVDPPGELPWASRSYDPEQEEEAAWLGAVLQLPRSALISCISQKLDNAAIAALFGASPKMVAFRRNTSGVDIQFARRASYKRVLVRHR